MFGDVRVLVRLWFLMSGLWFVSSDVIDNIGPRRAASVSGRFAFKIAQSIWLNSRVPWTKWVLGLKSYTERQQFKFNSYQVWDNSVKKIIKSTEI